MAKYPSEKIRITPLLMDFTTAGATSLNAKTRYTHHGDFSVLVGARIAATLATGMSASVAHSYDFSVIEATAASVAGSVITGATITLGAATACQVYGAVNLILRCATNLATTENITINGISYNAKTAGATAKNGGAQLADSINGAGTANAFVKLPHYTAYPNYMQKDLVLLTADDDQGTGLTGVSTGAAGTIQMLMTDLQGVVDIQASKLSTNAPKFIGVAATYLTGETTGIHYAQMISYPSGMPAMPGRKVSCTT